MLKYNFPFVKDYKEWQEKLTTLKNRNNKKAAFNRTNEKSIKTRQQQQNNSNSKNEKNNTNNCNNMQNQPTAKIMLSVVFLVRRKSMLRKQGKRATKNKKKTI